VASSRAKQADSALQHQLVG